MRVFKIPDALADSYHGSGYALAAVTGGQLVGLRYFSDLLPDFDGSAAAARSAVDDPRIGAAVRELQALGLVSVGMCSAWEFVEL